MANRKLLGEIDRILKKVQEGAKDFEGILQKLEQSGKSSQKEKYETDLKKTIKKLQRYRDQIKTWIQSNVVKDKRQLIDARKLIEANMEKFKVCEREMKTKAYSREGLQQAMQNAKEEDPDEEIKKWIGDSLASLRTQIDSFESQAESLLAKKGRRGGDANNDRIQHLETSVKRHRFHEISLERLLRKLENGAITKEQIEAIKDGVEYYIDSNQETDFYEDEEIYEELLGPPESYMNADLQHTDEEDTGTSSDVDTDRDDFKDESGAKSPATPNVESPLDLSNKMQRPASASPPAAKLAVTAAAAVPLRKSASNVKNQPIEARKAEPAGATAVAQKQQRPIPKGAQPAAGPPAQATHPHLHQPQPQPHFSAQQKAAQQPPQQPPQQRYPLQTQSQPSSTPAVQTKATQPAHANASAPASVTSSQPQAKPTATAAATAKTRATANPPTPTTSVAALSPHVSASAAPSQQPAPKQPASLSQQAKAQLAASTHQQLPSVGTENRRPSIHEDVNGSFPGSASHKVLPVKEPFQQQQQQQQQGYQPFTQPSQQASEIQEDSKNNETFESETPQTPGSLAELASATLEMVGNVAAQHQTPSPLQPQQLQQQQQQGVPQQQQGVPQQQQAQLTQQQQMQRLQQMGSLNTANLQNMPIALQRQYVQQLQAHQQQLRQQLQQQYAFNLKLLDTSVQHMPQSPDAERPRQYVPQNPVPTPPYYPTAPLPALDNPAIFDKFDTDTLFFIFYYQQGTYQQYLAARELKKQSWRYHKKYLTWFQRHEEPKEITNDYEQGTYVYFDYETGWCQRKKTEFTFEYRYLEDGDV